VELRLGKLEPALADFNTVVHAYGRGVAELRKGQKAQGDADIAAAKQVSSDVASDAAKLGLAP